jgi:ankyrin repeat protein
MGCLDMASHLLSVGAYAEGSSNPFSADHRNGSIEIASLRGHVAVVELLLDNGADPNIAIAPAASRGHFLLLRKLLERGITPKSAVTGVLGDLRHFDPARLLSNMQAGPYLDVVRLLLDAGLGPNENTGKNSPLAGAVSAEHTALLEFLLERGADLHSTGTAEECVRRAKKDGLVSMLLLLKAHDVDVDRICDTLSRA